MISVVIPLFNKEHAIASTIRSVINQTFQNFELLIINDGSTDSSLSIVNGFYDERIKVHTKINDGVSSARNFGIMLSNYEYIALLDADDLWQKDYLESLVNLITLNPGFYCYSSNYIIHNGEFKTYPRFKKNDCINEVFIYKDFEQQLIDYPILTSSSVILHKKLIDIVGCFNVDISQGEDLDMWLRISKSLNMVFLNKYLVTYNVDSYGNTFKMPVKIKNNLIYHFSPYDIKSKTFFSFYSYNVAVKYLLYNNFNSKEFKFILSKISKYSSHYFIVCFLSLFPTKFILFIYNRLYS